jgi:class 3 adenylate cyclase
MLQKSALTPSKEPSQVFTLLETIFQQFDELAKRRHVFKVETIGDCYVAVTGLPTRRSDHAVSMARFASDCRLKVATLTNMLEKTLGPGK